MLHAHLFANDLKNSSTSAKGKSLWISSISRSIGTSKTRKGRPAKSTTTRASASRSEEHTSELQSQLNLVCRLMLEKNNKIQWTSSITIMLIRIRITYFCQPALSKRSGAIKSNLKLPATTCSIVASFSSSLKSELTIAEGMA